MTITPSQRTTIMKLWSKVCKDRGWKSSDRDFRLAKFGEIIGRPIESADQIGRIDECTKLMKELKVMLGVDLQAAREADDLTINLARVLRNQILTELIPCLELYVTDVQAYLAEIMEDKNRWWKIDRPARGMTLMDLDAKPIKRWDKKTSTLKEFPSQLEQIQYTLSARLNAKRKESGDTVHDMKIKAGVPCHCARCNPRRPLVLILPPVTEEKTDGVERLF
jgi:hypothetical protein